MTESAINKPMRSSNIELYRIIVMLLIVAHHSIVNSGVMELVAEDSLSIKSTFAYLFGMWGKTGINCFVLITGYFMCTSHISGRKFAKLLLEVLFYNLAIGTIFLLTNYTPFTLKTLASMCMPIKDMTFGFTSAFLVFFLTIPFLNKLVHSLDQKEHLLLVLLSTGIYVIPRYLPLVKSQMNYVVWFGVIYFIASYLRLYTDKIYKSENAQFWGLLTGISILLSAVLSVVLVRLTHNASMWSYLMSDCQGIMALIVAVCSFMCFKNLKIKQSRFINTVASSCFGVLLIHANSDSMRQWLWYDTINVRGLFIKDGFAWKIILSIFIIYVICTIIDYIRIQCLESFTFALLDKKFNQYKWWSLTNEILKE